MYHYESLPKADRRAAQRLANRLLKSVPAANEPLSFADLREEFHSAFMKAEKLVAVLIHRDGENENWHADLVFRRRNGFQQKRVPEGAVPLISYEAALARVSDEIAALKATKEQPIVGEVRDSGCDPEDTELFEVRHKDNQVSHFLTRSQVARFAVAFCENVMPPGVYSFADRVAYARAIVLEFASEFATLPENQLICERLRVSDRRNRFYSAVGYLLSFGVDCVDDCDVGDRYLTAANARLQEMMAA